MVLRTLFLLLLVSCAGYRVKTKDNPFRYYGIRSISIPMFINKSVFPNVSPFFTKENFLALEGYHGLKIIPGENFEEADAVLIGIISSDQYVKNAKKTTTTTFTTGELKNSIGNRNPFYFPRETQLQLSVRFILIKKPTAEEIKLLQSLYPESFTSARVVFNKVIPLSHVFTRSIAGTRSNDEGGVVNQTKNLGSIKKGIELMAKSSAIQLRELIIYAF